MQIRRRHFLCGLGGAVVGLPLLTSLAPNKVRAGTGSNGCRFVCFFTCNGVETNRFWPDAGYGALNAGSLAGSALEPLGGFASRLLIPRGMHMVPRGFGWDPSAGDDHAKGMGCKLTAQPLVEGSTFAAGISLDQEIAKHLNTNGAPALSLMVGRRADGVLGHISYMGDQQPVSGEQNPWLAYQDIMGLSGLDETELQLLIARRQSVLDLVEPEYQNLLSQDLSTADRNKLEAHFDAIRDLEGELEDGIACGLPDAIGMELMTINPDTVTFDSEYEKLTRLQIDVMALALACGNTSSATLQLGSGAGGPIFTWDGMNHTYNHHKLSHGNTADDDSGDIVDGYEDMLHAIDRWHAKQFGYLLERLDSYPDDGGSVLDGTCCLWMNELSHGLDHDFRDLPVVMAGSAGGYFKQGEYIKVTAQDQTKNDVDAPHNKLLTTILNAVGVKADGGGPVTNFGGAFGEPGEFEMLKA